MGVTPGGILKVDAAMMLLSYVISTARLNKSELGLLRSRLVELLDALDSEGC